jgi:hypothetical protein
MKAAFDTDKIAVGLARFSRFYPDSVDVFGHGRKYSTPAGDFPSHALENVGILMGVDL